MNVVNSMLFQKQLFFPPVIVILLSKTVPYLRFWFQWAHLLTFNIKYVYNWDMDEMIANQYEELEEDLLPVEVVKPTIGLDPVAQEALDRERLKRKLEISDWAEKKRFIVNAPPTEQQLNKIFSKLKKGFPILKALKKVCSYTTWCKWREEYPILMKMEEEAREYRIERLMEKQQEIADQVDRDKMGQIARDKLRIDALQGQIDRFDRLTENRNNKMKGNPALVPIQINVGYGKRK